MEEKEMGYVYILTNPSFREDWVKIGKSSRPVDVRSKELDNTAVPLPFEIFATMKTSMYSEVERLVHKTIDRLSDLRIRQNREFFNVPPQVALDIFYDIAKTKPGDAEVVVYKDGKPINDKVTADKPSDEAINEPNAKKVVKKYKKIRSPFKFSMCGIKVGEEIIFNPTGIKVKVASDDTIEYEGRIYKLSPFVGTFIPEDMRYPSNKYGGPTFFSYNGKVLDKIRKERENEEN